MNDGWNETVPERVLDVRSNPLEWQRRGLQQTASGYGSKLTTRLQVLYRAAGDRQARWRRVYVTAYGNMGSAWLIIGGQRVALDVDTEHRLLQIGL